MLEAVRTLSFPIMGYKNLNLVPVAEYITCKHSMQTKGLVQNLRSKISDFKGTLNCLQMPGHQLVTLCSSAAVLLQRYLATEVIAQKQIYLNVE